MFPGYEFCVIYDLLLLTLSLLSLLNCYPACISLSHTHYYPHRRQQWAVQRFNLINEGLLCNQHVLGCQVA